MPIIVCLSYKIKIATRDVFGTTLMKLTFYSVEQTIEKTSMYYNESAASKSKPSLVPF